MARPLPARGYPRGFKKPVKPVFDPTHPLSRGLIGCWPLGVSAYTPAADIGPRGLNGTVIAAPPLTSAHHGGNANSFNGSSQYITIPLDLSAYNVVTVSGWYAMPSGYTSTGLVWEFTDNGYGTSGSFAFAVNDPTSSNCSFGMGSAGNTWADQITKPSTGAVHQFTVVYDRVTPQIVVYVDGLAVSQTTITHLTQSGNFANSTLNVMVRNAGTSLFAQGSFDGLRLYGRALSISEVAALYAEPYAGIYSAGLYNLIGVAATASTPWQSLVQDNQPLPDTRIAVAI